MEQLELNYTEYKAFDWNQVFYYPGAGIDIEPIKRFTHLTDTFFYVNIYLSKSDIIKGITQACYKESDLLECQEIIDYTEFDESSFFPAGYVKRAKSGYSWLNQYDKQAYSNAFQSAAQSMEKDWLLEFKIYRKDNGRQLRLIYMRGEGLATYMAFSSLGAPRILCTIQTDVLEYPNGLMTEFLNKTETRPLIWIRGQANTEPYGIILNHNEVHGRDDLYPVNGLGFLGAWNVYCEDLNWTYADRNSIRYSRGFITEETRDAMQRLPFNTFGENKILQHKSFEFTTIDPFTQELAAKFKPVNKWSKVIRHSNNLIKSANESSEHTLFILPNSILEKYHLKPEDHPNIITYEALLSRPPKLNETLHILETITAEGRRQNKQIHFIPFMPEDNGEILAKFLSQDHGISLTAWVKSPMDLADLRTGFTEWVSSYGKN